MFLTVITSGNSFPTVITSGNAFPTVTTRGDTFPTFPTVISDGKVFATVITSGTTAHEQMLPRAFYLFIYFFLILFHLIYLITNLLLLPLFDCLILHKSLLDCIKESLPALSRLIFRDLQKLYVKFFQVVTWSGFSAKIKSLSF